MSVYGSVRYNCSNQVIYCKSLLCNRHSKQAGTVRPAGRAEHPIASLYTTAVSQAFGEPGGVGGGVVASARTAPPPTSAPAPLALAAASS